LALGDARQTSAEVHAIDGRARKCRESASYVNSGTTFATCPQPSLLISESQLLLLAPNRDAMQQSA
jgi:hypothetical protein